MKWHTQELALPEFWNPPTPPPVNRAQWQSDTVNGFDRDSSWGGMSKADTLALPQRGWPAGVDAALRLLNEPELATVGAARLRRRWSPDDGETLDVARFYAGLPCWQEPYRAPGGSGGRIKTIMAHASANCNVSAQALAWRAYAIVRYVDALESAGYRVAIVAQYAARNAYKNGDSWECLVAVKAPEDPLDLSQVAAVLSAAAFRWHGFTWEATVDKALRSGRGRDTERRPDDPNTVYLPGTVRDRASAQRWLGSVDTDTGRE